MHLPSSSDSSAKTVSDMASCSSCSTSERVDIPLGLRVFVVGMACCWVAVVGPEGWRPGALAKRGESSKLEAEPASIRT